MSVTPVGTAIATLGVNTRAWFAGLTKAQKQWQSFGAQLQVNAFRIGAMWTATVGVIIGATLKMGVSFEKAFAGIKKTVEGTPKQFENLKQSLIDTAKASGISADSLAELARMGGQLGVGVGELDKFTDSIAKLSIAASELDPEQAATGLARLLNITGEGVGNINEVASVLARLGDSFATTEDRILNFAQRMAGLGRVTGITANDILALGAAFTATVPGVELVATQMSKAMAIFANAVATGGEKLDLLDALVAHTGTSFKTAFEDNAAKAIEEFLRGLNNVHEAGGNVFEVLKGLSLTNQRAAQAFLSAAKNVDKFGEALDITADEIDKVAAGGGKLEDTFAEQMKTVSAQWGTAWESMREVAINLFEAFAPNLVDLIGLLKDFLGGANDLAKWFKEAPSWVKIVVAAFILVPPALIAIQWAAGGLIMIGTGLLTSWGNITKLLAGGFSTAATKGATQLTLFGKASTGAAAGMTKLGVAIKTAFIALGVFIAAYELTKLLLETTGLRKEWDAIIDNWRNADLYAALASEATDRTKDLALAYADLSNKGLVPFIALTELVTKSEAELNAMIWEGNKALQEQTTGMDQSADATARNTARLTAQALVAMKAAKAFKELRESFAAGIFEIFKGETAVEEMTRSLKELGEAALKIAAIDAEKMSWFITGTDFSAAPGPAPVGGLGPAGDPTLPDATGEMTAKLREMARETYSAEDAMKSFNKTLSMANKLGRLFGDTIGKAITGVVSSLGGLQSVLSAGGIKGLFSAGKEDGGILGGIMNVAGPLMAIAGPIISGLTSLFSAFGKSDIVEDVGRDMGVTISQGLAESIRASGEPTMLAIGSIFQEGFASGGATADMLAESIGDLFSGFERGEFSEMDLLGALGDSVPMLIERLQELGPAGEEQLQRIIGAAQAMGIEFEGLSELISGTFAPDTLEEMMEAFDLTNEQVRALGEKLGIDIQTNLERMAATVGLSVEEFKALGAAVESEYGIPMEDIGALLEAMGISAEELAAALGVEVGGASEELDDNLEKTNLEMATSVDLAEKLAKWLKEAAISAGGINIPPVGSSSAQVGFQGDVISPTTIRVAETGPENVNITPQDSAGGGGGGGVTIIQLDGVEIARAMSEQSKTGGLRIVETGIRDFIWAILPFSGLVYGMLSMGLV